LWFSLVVQLPANGGWWAVGGGGSCKPKLGKTEVFPGSVARWWSGFWKLSRGLLPSLCRVGAFDMAGVCLRYTLPTIKYDRFVTHLVYLNKGKMVQLIDRSAQQAKQREKQRREEEKRRRKQRRQQSKKQERIGLCWIG